MTINFQKQNNRLLFGTMFALLIGLIFVRYVLQINFPWVILLAVVAVTALLGDRDEIVALGVCCIALYTSLQYIYALAICMLIYILKYWKDIRIDGGIFPVLLMLAWEWMHCFDQYSSIMGAVRAMMPLVFCAFLMFCPKERIHYPFVVRTFTVCVLLMCMVVLSKLLVGAGFNISKAFSNMQRLGTASEETSVLGADFNPNFLGFLCILASTGILQLRMSGQGKKAEMGMVVVLLLCGMLTLSRTYLVCLALMALLFILASGYDLAKLVKILGAVVGIGAVTVVLMVLIFPETIQDWVGRFKVEDITSGRIALLERFNERIFSNPDIYMFGLGIQFVEAKVIARFGAGKILGAVVPHNAIQEMVFCWGVPGLLLFVGFMINLVNSAKRKNPQRVLLNYIPLILLLVKIQAGQLITTPQNALMLSLVYLSMCHSFAPARE